MFKDMFSIDSKLYQWLMKLSNIVYLNILFLLCCIPVVTIGAAHAGMMNACRQMQNPDDDGSCFVAFFRGFKTGFWKITAIWIVLMAVIAAMLYILFAVIYFNAIWNNAPVIPAIVGLTLGMLMQSMAAAFHSRFDCSIWQIIRSSWYMVLMHPIKSLGLALGVWGPIIVALLDLYLFYKITPLWMFAYFTIAFQLCTKLMKGPFQEVEDQFVTTKDRSDALEQAEQGTI